MKQPLVSIIVPCYNQAQFLDEALQSVFEQHYPHWECIIVNDGSKDKTEAVAHYWCSKDNRFSYTYQRNQGLSATRNFGISKANGTYIVVLDADDKLNKNYLQCAIQEFSTNPNLKIVYSHAEFFGAKSGKWHLKPYSFLSLCRFNMIFCSAVFLKSDWERVGGYDKNMIYGFEDWEFWIHILKAGGEVKHMNFVGFYYRVKNESMIKRMTDEQIRYSQDYVLDKHREVYYKNYDTLLDYKKQMTAKLRSRIFIVNLLTNRFFGFKLFKDK